MAAVAAKGRRAGDVDPRATLPGGCDSVAGVCRHITELRGPQPPATQEEVAAAALQYVRKVTGLRQPPTQPEAAEAYAAAIDEITHATAHLLAAMPPRRQPPATVPPLRRPEVRARLGLG